MSTSRRPTPSALSFGRLCSAPRLAYCLPFFVFGCQTAALKPEGAKVATSQSAPIDSGWDPSSCKPLGYIVGRGGGAVGGAWLSNNKLIAYAMNDLRNQAAELGANFVQHDSPTLGQSASDNGSVTTTATISGTAYSCTEHANPAAPPKPAPSAPSSPHSCMPGVTQACLGPGACQGAQYCLESGQRFSPCDCGGPSPLAPASPAPATPAPTGSTTAAPTTAAPTTAAPTTAAP